MPRRHTNKAWTKWNDWKSWGAAHLSSGPAAAHRHISQLKNNLLYFNFIKSFRNLSLITFRSVSLNSQIAFFFVDAKASSNSIIWLEVKILYAYIRARVWQTHQHSTVRLPMPSVRYNWCIGRKVAPEFGILNTVIISPITSIFL